MHTLNHSPCSAFIHRFQRQNLFFPQVDWQKLRFYPVVDNLETLTNCVQKGVKTIQLRVKEKSYDVIYRQAKVAQEICDDHGVQFFLNDYWQIALELQLFGVHLGFEDLQQAALQDLSCASLRIGISTHSWFELGTAMAINPSYLALGPIYPTKLKKMRFEPQGLSRITQWRNALPKQIPLVAIGGITLEKATPIYHAGADSIAVASDIFSPSVSSLDRVKEWIYCANSNCTN